MDPAVGDGVHARPVDRVGRAVRGAAHRDLGRAHHHRGGRRAAPGSSSRDRLAATAVVEAEDRHPAHLSALCNRLDVGGDGSGHRRVVPGSAPAGPVVVRGVDGSTDRVGDRGLGMRRQPSLW